jgi:hypothetical protein
VAGFGAQGSASQKTGRMKKRRNIFRSTIFDSKDRQAKVWAGGRKLAVRTDGAAVAGGRRARLLPGGGCRAANAAEWFQIDPEPRRGDRSTRGTTISRLDTLQPTMSARTSYGEALWA